MCRSGGWWCAGCGNIGSVAGPGPVSSHARQLAPIIHLTISPLETKPALQTHVVLPSSAYSLFSKEMLNTEAIKQFPSKERMSHISEAWKQVIRGSVDVLD